MIDDNNPFFLKVNILVVIHPWDYRVSHKIKIAFSIQLILSAWLYEDLNSFNDKMTYSQEKV